LTTTCASATAAGEQNKEDTARADVPLLLIAFAEVMAASKDELTTGDRKPSLTWDGRSSATGVSWEQNDTCSRTWILDLTDLNALPHPALKLPLQLDFVALDDRVLLPAAVAAGAAALDMHGLEDGSVWLRRWPLYDATSSGSMSHSGTQESLSSPSHLTWNSLKLQSPCRTTLQRHENNEN
jgi:hypothetical protein